MGVHKLYKKRLQDLPGCKFPTNNSGEIEIIEYRGANNILIRFIDTGDLKVTNWRYIQSGMVRNKSRFKVTERDYYGNATIGNGVYSYKEDTRAFAIWTGILRRCYDGKIHALHPSYKNCYVCSDWLNFQKFAHWYYKNMKVGYDIDKDILVKNNKVYSPETCAFVPKRVNSLFIKRNLTKGDPTLPVGVYQRNKDGNIFYVAMCNDADKTQKYLGCYYSVDEAFLAYKKHKEFVIKQVAEEYKDQIDQRVYEAMINYQVEITD